MTTAEKEMIVNVFKRVEDRMNGMCDDYNSSWNNAIQACLEIIYDEEDKFLDQNEDDVSRY